MADFMWVQPMKFDRIIELRWSSSQTLKRIDYSQASQKPENSVGVRLLLLTPGSGLVWSIIAGSGLQKTKSIIRITCSWI